MKILKLSTLTVMLLVTAPCDALVVQYEGDVLPAASSQPFSDLDSALGTRTINADTLLIDVTSAAGSLSSVRNDALSDADNAVFQFRTRIDRIGAVSPGAIPGAVVQVRWGGDSGVLVFHVADGRLILNAAGLANNTVFTQAFSTQEFHTYSIVKVGNQRIDTYADAQLLASIPFAEFDFAFGPLSGWQSFSNNPNSSSQWDYFRYAIGPTALEDLPVAVPTPGTAALMLAGMLAAAYRRRPATTTRR